MKVILRKDVKGRGRTGDIVEVAHGYARNYLIPQGFATLASPGALEVAEKLNATSVSISVNAGEEGKLFGSVTVAQVAKEIEKAASLEIDKRDVTLSQQIKALGSYSASIELHPEVSATVAIEIVAIDK